MAGVSSGLAGRERALMRIDRLDHLVLTVADVGSVYIRDPDGNLIEISNYLAG